MYDFGLRLKQLRTKRGLTQRQLASKINKSPSAISSYESNIQMPPLDVCISISVALGVPLDYLAGNEQEPVYRVKTFSPAQQSFIDKLLNEFCNPTNQSDYLSDQQIQLLRQLIILFSKSS